FFPQPVFFIDYAGVRDFGGKTVEVSCPESIFDVATMFECKLEQTVLFKKVVAAVLDIVKEGNFDLSDEGIRVQTMDTTHVALVQMELKESAFDEFRCDRESCVGINFEALTKLLKLCRDDDSLSLKKEE
ncbi:hypothetical protein FOZ63_019122, partial [Perkinsus olseni]